ncbi:CMRF35-like molecule 1 isoform X2 [Suricata suricatta]|uniref:Immunoglobulin domain-containing protein n=1 Tax=Suricata suricatta TaxID=37032 RepID=A0A673V9T9_SURSU|nr:CMRF35-like molecule 1 isoform X2 [Suricata suricatta]
MPFLLLFLFLFGLAGSSPISGPVAVRGLVGGSLTVQCHYEPGWETYKKWWCRGAKWSKCHILVKTNGSEQEAKNNQVSIQDNQKNYTFTVTMEKLKETDADTYWCGIERSVTDLGVSVKVTIDPAPTTVPTTTSNAQMSTAPAETKGPPTMSSHHSSARADSINLSILLPLIFGVLLLLLVAASLLALRMMKQQKKAAEPSPEKVLQPPEGDLCYANLTLQPTGTSHGSSQKKVCTKSSSSDLENQQEVDYVTMAPFPKENVSYAALSWEFLDQEPTYSNTDVFFTHVPSRNHEEPIRYSTVRRP